MQKKQTHHYQYTKTKEKSKKKIRALTENTFRSIGSGVTCSAYMVYILHGSLLSV